MYLYDLHILLRVEYVSRVWIIVMGLIAVEFTLYLPDLAINLYIRMNESSEWAVTRQVKPSTGGVC